MSLLKGKQIKDSTVDLSKLRGGTKLLPSNATLGTEKPVVEITDTREFISKGYADVILASKSDVESALTGIIRVTTGAERTDFDAFDMVSLPQMIGSPVFSVGENSNFCLQSETFDNATWIKTGATVTANTLIGPSGDMVAERIVAGTLSTHGIHQVITNTTTGWWTFSVWLRSDNAGGVDASVTLTFETSVGVQISKSFTVDAIWRRYRVTVNVTAAHTNKTVRIINGTHNVGVFGAMLDSSDKLRGYYPTTTASVAVNRNAYFRNSLVASLSATGTLTGTFSGTFSGTMGVSNALLANTINTTLTPALNIYASTASTSSVTVRNSPSIRWYAQAWDTANRTADFHNLVTASASAGGITGMLDWRYGYNNANYKSIMTLEGSGTTSVLGVLRLNAELAIGNTTVLTEARTLQNVTVDWNSVNAPVAETVAIYITNATEKAKLENVDNWTDATYSGATAVVGSQGQRHYDNVYFYECVDTNTWIRMQRI
jgi:hypothetical protein